MKTAVVLLSGGIDSTVCLGMAIRLGFDPIAVSFDYNQRHRVELDAARQVAAFYGVRKHFVFSVGLFREIGGSALTDNIAVPHGRSAEVIGYGIPVTYVPARNLVFLSYALGVAERAEAQDIFIGVNAVDYSGYPDCRPEFILSFQSTANLATAPRRDGGRYEVHAPLAAMSKEQIIRTGVAIGAPLHLTHSCYAPDGGASCGRCDSCYLRLAGFSAAGVEDPIRYVPLNRS